MKPCAAQVMVDVLLPGRLQELEQLLHSCFAIVACPLYSSSEGQVTAYHSPTQALTKGQSDALRKARRQAAKVHKLGIAAAALDVEGGDVEQQPQQQTSELEGVGLLIISGGNAAILSRHAQRVAATAAAAAAAAGGTARLASATDPIGAATTPSVPIGPVFFIPTCIGLGRSQAPGALSSGPRHDTSRRAFAALVEVVTPVRGRGGGGGGGGKTLVSCDAKGLLRDLGRLGVPLPLPSGLSLADPCLLAWLADPQQASHPGLWGRSVRALGGGAAHRHRPGL